MMDKQVEEDCDTLKKLLKKKGEELNSFVLSKTKEERQVIKSAYKSCYGVDLEKDIDKQLSGHYKKAMLALFASRVDFDAECLYLSMKGMGTDDSTLIEILCTRSAEQLKQISEVFPLKYKGDTLEKWVKSETSGAYRKLLVSLCQCNRHVNPNPDPEQCKQWAQDLYKAGEAKLGTDEDVFNKIFSLVSPEELVLVEKFYSEISPRTLKHAIDKEYSGNVKLALQTILNGMMNPAEYFADKIKKSVKGLGTKDKMLIRILVSREGIDLPKMREVYKTKYGKGMAEEIKDDTTGDYQKLLFALANGN